jgi:hypothetical protein
MLRGGLSGGLPRSAKILPIAAKITVSMLTGFLCTVLTYSLVQAHAPLDIAGGKSTEVAQAL